jgi:hypothetical protein
MSWWEALHLVISAALAIGLFVVSDDEPFWVRLCQAVLVGLLWLPLLILFALMLLVDGVATLIARWRK